MEYLWIANVFCVGVSGAVAYKFRRDALSLWMNSGAAAFNVFAVLFHFFAAG